ncbi:IclR family transcriptional regulator [Oceanomicrobium pacificus]|uniref:Helix-turn-helix domain-containing protein n=1 Tax=Oceanomicrobium pacificus TaxID=2692916 RepID=A0A6B0TQS3_9RHOB|nr:IclR family transcriptional regulator [Oceanomicrobium pacificus]MXU64108.1 helix-turn-helix domain-containing protein [Oceanomicrobium pacificus]
MTKSGHSDGTVGKALEVLDAVAAYGRPVRFKELLADGAYPKATLYRLLQTLTNQNMLSFDAESGYYTLGGRLIRLAHAAWQAGSLGPLARPHIDALSLRLGETVHLAQLDDGQVLYIDKRNATRPIPMYSDAGKIGPGYCTGVGKAMLAFLPDSERTVALAKQSYYRHTEHTLTTPEALEAELAEIRQTGISFDREEHEPQIICVAVPILGQGLRPLGALSVTTTTLRHSLDDLEALAPDLKACATAIARDADPWVSPTESRTVSA